MRSKLMLVVIMLIQAVVVRGNPVMEQSVTYVNIDPPQIGVTSLVEADFSNVVINTSQGTATVNEGVIIPENYGGEPFIFDSSNTSGFAFNNESDYIEMNDDVYYVAGACFGQYCLFPAPIPGHAIRLYDYFYHGMDTQILCFEDAAPRYGLTNIVINEINANSTWGSAVNFIELYNCSDQAINIGRWRIIVDDLYEIPEGTTIPPHGFYAIDTEALPEDFDLSAAADNVYLLRHFSPDGWVVVDQVGWSTDHGSNVSLMRCPDGDVHNYGYEPEDAFRGYDDESSTTFEIGFPTRGAANRHDCPGFVVIGAIADSIDEGSARIHWTDPIWDDGFDYSVLVSNDDHFPQAYDDGNAIYQGTGQQFDDTSIPPVGPMFYTVFAHNTSGSYSTPTSESQTNIFFNSAGIEERNLPDNIGYLNCYPNPFNAQSTISFSIAKAGKVEIAIYDITGRLVETVADEYYAAGEHSVIWNGDNYSSGTYFAKLTAGSGTVSSKLVLLK